MSGDKRSVSTDALETLGTILAPGAARDAIHVAVEPVVAAVTLYPGQHVGLIDGEASPKAAKYVGIVDPFLVGPILPGQSFWLLVYPRTITSLRHVWAHPDFDSAAEPQAEAAETPVQTSEEVSARWIQDFAASVKLEYHEVMQGAHDYLESRRKGGYGYFLNFGDLLYDKTVPPEFWDHFEVVTGQTVGQEHRGSFFTCSC